MRLRGILLLGFLAALTMAADSAKQSATKGESAQNGFLLVVNSLSS